MTQMFSQCVHCKRVPRSDRRHVDQLPFEELDAVAFAKNADLSQAMILLQGQAVPGHRMTFRNIDVANVHAGIPCRF